MVGTVMREGVWWWCWCGMEGQVMVRKGYVGGGGGAGVERGLPEWMWSEARGGDKVEGKVSAVMRWEMMVKWENVSDDGGNIVMRGERGVVSECGGGDQVDTDNDNDAGRVRDGGGGEGSVMVMRWTGPNNVGGRGGDEMVETGANG